ncbi:unnamed protein product, partial [Plutella xylostella]
DEYLERESFETSYFSTVAAAQEALDKHTAASAARDNQSVTGSSAFSEHWDILIIHMVTSKLDSHTMRDWETERNHIKSIPTLEEFNSFLKNRADLLETMEEAQSQKHTRRHSDISHNRPKTFVLIPTTRINCEALNIPSHIKLADPTFSVPAEVHMLLGADLFWAVLSNNRINLGKNKPTLVETTLGWIVSGSIQVPYSKHNKMQSYNTVHCHFLNNIELEEKLDKFFEFESVSTTQQSRTKGESECEQIFTQTTTRHPDGNFIVTIPLKESPECLGDSSQQALIQFKSLERKFNRNSEFKQKYTDFLEEYQTLGHMSENTNPQDDKTSYIMPHHGILREDKLTTKLRTVFNASSITSSGKSFNDIQYIGPTVQDDLLSILIRFRQHKYVVSSDIEKMYRQIYVKEEQRSLQQIYWRSDPSEPIKLYKLNRVAYGTASAPYLATRCLMQLGQECTDKNVGETILHDFYVDDYISGNDDEQTLIQTCQNSPTEFMGEKC